MEKSRAWAEPQTRHDNVDEAISVQIAGFEFGKRADVAADVYDVMRWTERRSGGGAGATGKEHRQHRRSKCHENNFSPEGGHRPHDAGPR